MYGEIVRRGRVLGVPVPVNNALHVIVKLIEADMAPTFTPAARQSLDPDGGDIFEAEIALGTSQKRSA